MLCIVGMLSPSNSGSLRLAPFYRIWQRFIPFVLSVTLVITLLVIIYYIRSNEITPVLNNMKLNHDNITPLSESRSSDRRIQIKQLGTNVPLHIDSKSSLIYKQNLPQLSRPSISSHHKPISRRTDYRETTQRILQEALSLRDKGYTFRIIVYAWKRRASLKRLLDSLLSADYRGFTVHLDFHMDGGAHPAVVQFIVDFNWPHGKVRINRHGDRVGLEKTIMLSWLATNDKEFAFFFEDDIEVSSKYFDFAIACLHKYVIPYGVRAAPSVWNTKLIGISLNTPRYNEIIRPTRDWTPLDTIDLEDTQFLLQLPCSWGALYFPWKWREFLHYYFWRSEQYDVTLDDSVPDSATRFWKRSWKKYLTEHMYMRGEYMLYSSLEHQVSLSTHHREPGEHTNMNPEEPLVDDLGTLVLNHFTVPLVNDIDGDEFLRLIANVKPLREMPILSLHHEKVSNPYILVQAGLITRKIMEGAGWNKHEMSNNQCLLDDISFPVKNSSAEGREKYLLYEPQMGIHHQIYALQNAIAYAKILNRVLILPQIVISNTSLPMNRLLNISDFGEHVRTISMADYVLQQSNWVDRIVYNLPWSMRKESILSNLTDEYLAQYKMTPSNEIILHTFPLNETDIIQAYTGCNDIVLAFRHLYGSFSALSDPEANKKFKVWIEGAIKWSRPIQNLLDRFAKNASEDTACVVFSRASCGTGLEGIMTTDEDRLIVFRSCRATIDRTLEYAMEDMKTLKISTSSIYFINEVKTSTLPAAPKGKSLLTRNTILAAVQADNSFSDLPEPVVESIANMVEFEICSNAAFFLGHRFSLLSKEIIFARDDLPSNILGKIVNVIKK